MDPPLDSLAAHTNFLAAIRDAGVGPDDTPVTEPLVADLLVTYALDVPEVYKMFSFRNMKALGMTVAQFRAEAVASLRSRLTDIRTEGQPPVLMLVTGNDLEACLLLLDEVWESYASQVPGEIVVAVPTRSLVFVTSSESPEQQPRQK